MNRATVIAASAVIRPIVGKSGDRKTPFCDISRTDPNHDQPARHATTPAAPQASPNRRTSSAETRPSADDELRLERDGVLGPADEVLLQQVVGDGGLNLDAGKERVERRRHDLAGAERRRADEHDLVLEGVGADLAREHVDGRDVGERPLGAAIAQQQVALAVERHASGCRATATTSSTLATRSDTSRVPVTAATAVSAEARIDVAVELR